MWILYCFMYWFLVCVHNKNKKYLLKSRKEILIKEII